jgi:hypothetical protein
MRRGGEATSAAAGLRIAAAGRAGHAGSLATIPRRCSLPGRCGTGIVVAPRHLLCSEAIPLETSNAAAANMAEYFLMSSFFSFCR